MLSSRRLQVFVRAPKQESRWNGELMAPSDAPPPAQTLVEPTAPVAILASVRIARVQLHWRQPLEHLFGVDSCVYASAAAALLL